MKSYLRTDKIFHHLSRLKAWDEGKQILPVTMEIHPSTYCNLSCTFCSFAEYRKNIERKNMTLQDHNKIIDHLKGVKAVIYSGGGSPTMNKDLLKMIEYTTSKGIDVGLITNGVNLNKFDMESLRARSTWIRVSLNATNSESYKAQTGKDFFERVVKNIFRLVATKGQSTIGIQMVVNKDNINDIVEFAQLGAFLKVDYCQVRPLENLRYSKEELKVALKSLEKAAEVLKDSSCQFVSTASKWKQVGVASRGYDTCLAIPFIGAVDVFGNIYSCCHHVGDKDHCYGNLIQSDIRDLLDERDKVERRIDVRKCPLACRGSNINLGLNSFKHFQPHKNFL